MFPKKLINCFGSIVFSFENMIYSFQHMTYSKKIIYFPRNKPRNNKQAQRISVPQRSGNRHRHRAWAMARRMLKGACVVWEKVDPAPYRRSAFFLIFKRGLQQLRMVWGHTRHDLRVSSRSSSAKSARSCATTCSISGMATRMSLKQALRRTA